jgi:hypothetical protein
MKARRLFRTAMRAPLRLGCLRLWRSLAVPLALALPPLFWVVDATRRASITTLGRDQGIFQYVAWALAHGAIDYRDVRDVNGPLTHLVHVVFLALGGADEHRFRWLDLSVTGVSFAFVGACVPGASSGRRSTAIERAGWALAGWVTLSGQYLLYGFWDTAQRESFFDWFMLPSVALQLALQQSRRSTKPLGESTSAGTESLEDSLEDSLEAATPSSRVRGKSVARWQAWGLAAVGALSIVPWFGKPTYALFTFAQLAALLADRDMMLSRKRALAAFAVGAVAGSAIPVAFLIAVGDPIAYARIQFVDVPAMYRFIWSRSAADILSTPFFATHAIFAFAGAFGVLALVGCGEMPARAIAVALVPVCAVGSALAQAKGFPYHFHPVTAGVYFQWLVVAAWMAERTRVARKRWAALRLVPVAFATTIALHVGMALQDSPYVRDTWLLWGGQTAARRAEPEYFDHFVRSDFFPSEMREAAAYLRAHTGPGDAVQAYGMDPYILFLAGRMSATPYIYAYDLNVDAALAGGTGGRPDAGEADRIRQMREARETDLLRRVRDRPPAAFVFIDDSPLLSDVDAWADFEAHCGRTAAWVRGRYREAARFGHDHVWLPSSAAADVAPEHDRTDDSEPK